jgi:hypothetical protein
MDFDVHLHVCFPCDDNTPLAGLSKRHLDSAKHRSACSEAICFLEDLSNRTGKNKGPKGGLCLWGIVGNHSDVPQFIFDLMPFWIDLLMSGADGLPHPSEHIVIIWENEQSKKSQAVELFQDEEWLNTKAIAKLSIKYHELPFCFNQM